MKHLGPSINQSSNAHALSNRLQTCTKNCCAFAAKQQEKCNNIWWAIATYSTVWFGLRTSGFGLWSSSFGLWASPIVYGTSLKILFRTMMSQKSTKKSYEIKSLQNLKRYNWKAFLKKFSIKKSYLEKQVFTLCM